MQVGEERYISRRGFTLIELLVVIAIIGVLAGIVLAALNSARSGGNEARIFAQLTQARNTAEFYYSSNGNSYSTVDNSCSTASTIFTDTTSGMSKYTVASSYPGTTLIACDSSGTRYALRVRYTLPDASFKYFCVDYKGIITTSAVLMNIGGDSDCDADNSP